MALSSMISIHSSVKVIFPLLIIVQHFLHDCLSFTCFVPRSSLIAKYISPKVLRVSKSRLLVGRGIAVDYTWKEGRDDVDVTVTVPLATKGGDILFSTTQKSVDLRLAGGNDYEMILLNGNRDLRGKINMDGSFWSISDSDDRKTREVTVTLEKKKEVLGELEVEEDWGGIYPKDEDEVSERFYNKPEELDIREYAKSLGVDIDNINMSMVDKSMFSPKNITRGAMDDLEQGKYVEETMKQGDKEYKDKDGSPEEFSIFGDMVDPKKQQGIPFIDDLPVSPEVGEKEEVQAEVDIRGQDEIPSEHFPERKDDPLNSEEKDPSDIPEQKDPIDLLTVAHLKDILREQNLKVSGSKQELRDRLHDHLNEIMDDFDEKINKSFDTDS